MAEFKILFLIALLLTLFAFFGCTGETPIPGVPYTVSQFVRLTTTTDYNHFTNGDLNGLVLYMDWNRIGFRDANFGGGTGSGVDTNTQTAGFTDSQGNWIQRFNVVKSGSGSVSAETVADFNNPVSWARINMSSPTGFVWNRNPSNIDVYFGESTDTGKFFFRGAGSEFDGNLKVNGNYLCNDTNCYLISDLNIRGGTATFTDTNWETSFPLFDANMRGTYVPYTGATSDVNINSKNFFSTGRGTFGNNTTVTIEPNGGGTCGDIGGGGSSYSAGDSLSYKIYPYRTVNGTRIYASFETPRSASVTSDGDLIMCVWGYMEAYDPVPNAEGYRVLRALNGGGYTTYHDYVGNTTLDLTDNGSGWSAGSTITPTSYTYVALVVDGNVNAGNVYSSGRICDSVGCIGASSSTIDTNAWTAGIISDQNVFQIDLNTLGNLKADGNYLCDASNCFLISDLNVQGTGSSGIDTNWQTSWNTFDTNMKATYAQLNDVNTWGDLRYYPLNSNPANYLTTADVNLTLEDLNKVMSRGNTTNYDINLYKPTPELRLMSSNNNQYGRLTVSDTDNKMSLSNITAQVGAVGQSMTNTTSKFVTLANETNFDFNGNNPFSIEAWIYPTATTDFRTIAGKTDGTRGYILTLYTGSYEPYFYILDTSGQRRVRAGVAVTPNQWNHVVATYDGSGNISGAKIFVNNGGDTTVVVTAGATTSIMNNSSLKVGTWETAGYYFLGNIDELIVYDKALSVSEISASYNSGNGIYHTPDTNIKAILHMDNDVTDSSGLGNNGTWTGAPVYTTGIVSTISTDAEVEALSIKDGLASGESSIITLGTLSSRTILAGKTQQFWTSGIQRMALDVNGNLGIGTTTPLNKLQVVGDINSSGATSKIAFDGNLISNDNTFIYNNSTDRLGLGTTATDHKLTIQDDTLGAGFKLIKTGTANVATTMVLKNTDLTTNGGVLLYIDRGKQANSSSILFKTNNVLKARFGLAPSSDDFLMSRYTGSAGSETEYETLRINNTTGNIGVGVSTPTAKLHLVAGSSDANKAPLKFTSGNLLTTTEAGSIEFLTDDYYATISTGAGGQYTYWLPAQSDTYAKASSQITANFAPYIAMGQSVPVTGSWGTTNTWLTNTGVVTNATFQADLGSAKVINRLYYQNAHHLGGATANGAKNYTVWGSNDANFLDTNYSKDTNWTQIGGTRQFLQHVLLDQSDPQYETVTNTTAYRYYRLKIADNWGGTYIGLRLIQFQDTTQPSGREKIVLTNGETGLTSGRIPYTTTNGRLTDSSNFLFDGNSISLLSDSGKLKFGAGADAEIFYDGTDLNINPKSVGSGKVNIQGDLATDGNIFTNMIYGEDYNKSDTGFETLDLVNVDEYVRVTKLGAGSLNGFTVADGNLIASVAGVYQINAKASVESASVGGDNGMKVFVNDVGQNNCYDHEHTSNTPIGFIIAGCFVRLNVGDKLNLRFDDHQAPVTDLILLNANLNALRVGN